ncbi:hypothetical protein [Nocardioides sp. 1609]|uniref:hypothetical protein n=1 Tax=Nocardioides sp. 1609 TaxID=2508327 RepID=UPI00106FA241|nr:hypothetical protein [Nocardioides sp. 1609]
MTRRTASALVGALVAALVLTAGCSSTPSPRSDAPAPETPSAPRTVVVTPVPVPPGVHLSFVQQRIDEGTRRAQVRVVNGTDHTLRVREVGVDWAAYPLALHRVDYPVHPGRTVDLRYLLPRAVCTAAAAQAPIGGVAVTDRGTLRRPMGDDGVRFLTRLRDTECAARRLDAAATLSYGETWRRGRRDGRPVLRGSLVLTRPAGRSAGPPLRIAQVDGSVLFDVSLAGDRAGRTLRARQRQVAVPVLVRDGGRCDPHSRGQSTQTFLFRAFLSLDGAAPVSRLAPPDRALQLLLLRFLDRACAGTP